MLSRENKKNLHLLLFLLCLLGASVTAASFHKDGFVAGTMAYVDEREKTFLGNASQVTLELNNEERVISIISNEIGDFDVKLPVGTYCLRAARDVNNMSLIFSPNQQKCFRVRRDKITRFDVMLLKTQAEKVR
jgi:hypothetical protein